MANLQEYQRIKTAVEQRRREQDRAQGSYDTTLRRICDEFKVASVEEAKALLAKLTSDEEKAQKAFDTAVSKFKEAHPDVCA